MSITAALMQKIRTQVDNLADQHKNNQNTSPPTLTTQAKLVTDRIPLLIAQAMASGNNHALIMPLIAGRDFSYPSWNNRLLPQSPRATWLKGAAAAVFAWSEESGLQPFITLYFNQKRSQAAIGITWDNNYLQSELHGDSSFVEQLQVVTAEATTRLAAQRASDRVKLVRTVISEMHSAIERESNNGKSEALATKVYSNCRNPSLRNDSWTGDIIEYAESMGLTVRTETKVDHSGHWPGDRWKTDIYVSWSKPDNSQSCTTTGTAFVA